MTWIVDADDNRILSTDERSTIICHMSGTTRNPDIMRDARLIAAAPDLLEALEEAIAVGLVPKSSASEGGAMRHSAQVRCADKIRAAIAKAKGEA